MIYFLFFLGFIFLFSFQTTLLDFASLAGVTPDLALILTLYGAVILRGNGGIVAGCAIGFAQDCFSGGLLGVNTLSKGLIGFTFTALRKKIVVEGFVPLAVFLMVASIFDGWVYYFTSVFLFQSEVSLSVLFPKLLVYSIYNALIGPALFVFLNQNRKWVVRKFPSLEGSLR